MIEIRGLGKKFRTYNRRSDRLREWLSFGKKNLHSEFWALRDINLTVAAGQVFGIIGMNGAGKSTLLKILTGTMQPTMGTIKMHGRIAALLELGTGFHGELTGRENVLMNGKLLGLTDQEIRARMDSIEEFCELGEFFDKPARTYSSGMYVRLGFALASSVDPEILIIDEALSVGDAYFQQKCLNRIREFKNRGATILFVSHDAGAIKALCDQAALLDHGHIVNVGDAVDLLEQYNALLAKQDGEGNEYVIRKGKKDASGREIVIAGNMKANILRVELQNAKREKVEAVVAGDSCRIVVDVKFNEDIANPTVGILIRDRLGYDIFGTNTAQMQSPTDSFRANETRRFVFDLKMNLGPGSYTVTSAIHDSVTHVSECYEWVDRILTFKVLPRADYQFLGVSLLEPKISQEKIAVAP